MVLLFCKERTQNKSCLTAVSPFSVGLTVSEWVGLYGLYGDPASRCWEDGDLGLRGETTLLVAGGDEGLLSKEMERELMEEKTI